MQGYFPVELPIDFGIPSIVEEGGFPFETPTANTNVTGYTWNPMSPTGNGPAYYPNGQFYSGYDQEGQQLLHNDTDRSSTDRSLTRTHPNIIRLPSNTYFPIRHPESGGHDQYNYTPISSKPVLRRGTSQRSVRGKIRTYSELDIC